MFFAALLLSARGVRGQDAEPQLSGRVTEVGSGAPIAGATVELEPPFFEGNPAFQYFQSTKTDDDGNYRFMTVVAGGFIIHITDDGFVDGEYKTGADRFSTFLRFDSSDHFKGIDISMQPASAIRGSLTDKNGKPIANVMVSAVPQSWAIKNRFRSRRAQRPIQKETLRSRSCRQASIWSAPEDQTGLAIHPMPHTGSAKSGLATLTRAMLRRRFLFESAKFEGTCKSQQAMRSGTGS